jgi:hypothetical protein
MGIIPKAKHNLKNLTVLEREKAKKKLREAHEELLDEMGQESDKKAVRVVQEVVSEQAREDRLQQEMDLEGLKKASANKINYQRVLVAILQRFVQDEKIPKKYNLYAESNDHGIVVGITGTDYLRAFAPCGLPKYDIHACKILAVQVGNTIARMEGYFTQTASGIITPTREEFELAKSQIKRRKRG